MTFLPSYPNATLIDLFQAYPNFAKPLHEFADQLMRGQSPFTSQQRELIAAFVSSQNNCHYCRDSHTGVAVKLGESQEVIEQLVCDIDSANVSEALKPILRYVQKLTLMPDQVNQDDVDAILSMGWDEDAVVHASLVCAFFNLMNRWVEGLGIESNPETVQQNSDHLSKYGYQNILSIMAS